MELIVLFGLCCLLAIIPAKIAADKDRDFALWWFYGACLFIVALVHALLLPPSAKEADRKARMAGNLKCPSCAEWIRREATVCRFCGRDVEIAPIPRPEPRFVNPITDYVDPR